MMDMFTFTKDLTWNLATLPLKLVLGSGNHMHSNVLRKINPVVVITGCDSGVGLLTAIHLQTNGFQVVATCETDEGVAKLKDKVHTAIKMDVTKGRDIENVYRRTTEILSQDPRARFWALINNAATNVTAPIDWMDFNDFRRVAEVNFLGAVHMTKVFLPLLKTTPSSRVMNISGFGGMTTPPSMGAYAPTKHALEAFSEQLALELQQFDIHVVVIDLPKLQTPMMDNIEDSARHYYDHLPTELKRQYPRTEVEKYFENLGKSMRGTAEDPIRGVRMIMRAMRAQRPQFKYAPRRFIGWVLWEALVPLDIQHSFYSMRMGTIPKAISPAMPLPTAAA